ncbi:MAG: ABC transporter substrate-binding protein [Dehalococcoidia bacterium]
MHKIYASARLFGALSGVAAIVTAACQPSAPLPSATTSGSSAPAATVVAPSGPTGKLTVALSQPLLTSMDTGSGNSAQTLGFQWPAFDGLTWISADGKVNPGLAKSWRSVDERTWEFTLGDYKFHNGRAVEAQDVLDTFSRTADPDKKLPGRTIFTGNGFDKWTAPDAKTIRLTTLAPNPIVPNVIQLVMILPMKEVNVVGDVEFFRNKPIGTGAFRVDSADFNSSIKFTAMGKEWVTPRGVPGFQQLEMKIVPDVVGRVAALRTGDVDLATGLTADQVPQIEAAGFKIFQTGGTATAHYSLDMYNGPMTNLKVRQAMNYAVDKESVAKVFYGGRARVDTGQLIGPSVLGYNQSLQPYPYDVAKAKQLMAEAGYANGFTTRLTTLTTSTINKDLAQIIADNLREIGITVNIDVKEAAIWTQAYYGPPEMRAGIFAQVINWDQTFEPDSVYRWYSDKIAVESGRRWEDAEFAKLFTTAQTELDRNKRGTAYQAAAKHLRDQAPVIFGWQVFGVFAGKKTLTIGDPGHADFYIRAKGA